MNCTVEWDSSTAGSQYLVHERQRLLHIFLLLFGQILQHLLQLLLVVFHLAFNIWNNGQHTEADILQSDPWNLWVTHLNIADCLFFFCVCFSCSEFSSWAKKINSWWWSQWVWTNQRADWRRGVCLWTSGGFSSERGRLHFLSELQTQTHSEVGQTPPVLTAAWKPSRLLRCEQNESPGGMCRRYSNLIFSFSSSQYKVSEEREGRREGERERWI